MAGNNNNEESSNNRNNNSGNNNNNNQQQQQRSKAPVIVDMQFAGWLRLAQVCVFGLNSLLNWVCLWFFAPPLPAKIVQGVEQVPDSVWTGWKWWILSAMLSMFLQIIFVYVPLFIDENSKFLGKWRSRIQHVDVYLNYIAWTIILCYVMGVAPDLRDFLTTTWGILDQLVGAFGTILSLRVILAIVLIWMLSMGTHKLGLITTLAKRTEEKKGGK